MRLIKYLWLIIRLRVQAIASGVLLLMARALINWRSILSLSSKAFGYLSSQISCLNDRRAQSHRHNLCHFDLRRNTLTSSRAIQFYSSHRAYGKFNSRNSNSINISTPFRSISQCINKSSTSYPMLITYFSSCLLYTSPSPRDRTRSRMPSSA